MNRCSGKFHGASSSKQRCSGHWARVVFLGLSLCAFGHAKTIHVATGGSDANAGNAAAPFASLSKAAATSAPGDTILVRAGTYRLAAQLEPNSGTSESARITWKAYPGEVVVIDGQAGYCMTLSNRSFLTFQGLRFTTSDTAVGAGMVYFENTKKILFQDCEFYGMPAQRGGENSSVIRCMSTGWPDAANLENSDSCTFRNNYFHDNASPAMRLYDTKGWVIENNTFRDCAQAVGGKDEPYDMLVRRNLVVGGGLAFYFAMQGGGRNVTITENIVVGTDGGFNIGGLGTYDAKRRDVKVFNNTFYNVRNAFFGWSDPDFDTGIRIWNNIVHSTVALNIGGGDDIAGRFVCLNKYGKVRTDSNEYSIDHNEYSMPASDRSLGFFDGGKSFAALADWKTGRPPFDAHSISVDPLFVNVPDSNFHLQAGSLCRKAGRTGEDLGAYPRGDDGTVIGRIPAGSVSVAFRRPGLRGTVSSSGAFRTVDGRIAGPGTGAVYLPGGAAKVSP